MDAIEQSVADVEHEIAELFNSGNIDGILEHFSSNFIGFSSTRHERVDDREQLKKTFLHYLDEGDRVTYSVSDISVRIYGEAASSSFYWEVQIEKGRKKSKIHGRGSHVFLQDLDGWKIVHEHYSKAH
jgi:ketosteroid isomerase-like protein